MLFTHKITNEISISKLDTSFAQELFDAIDTDRQFLKLWLEWVDHTKTVEDSKRFLEDSIVRETSQNSGTFHILYNSKLVGQISYFNLKKECSAEIGYWLNSSHNGKGIMTEVTKTIIKYCFDELKLNRVVIKTATFNYKSKNIPKKLNFTLEGVERGSHKSRGEFVNTEVYSILKSDLN